MNEKTIKEKLDINYVMVIKGFLITYSLRYPEGRENKEEKEGENYYAQIYSSTFFKCERFFGICEKSVWSLITQDKVAKIRQSMLFSNVGDVFLFAMQYFLFQLVYDKSFDLSRVNSIGHTIV